MFTTMLETAVEKRIIDTCAICPEPIYQHWDDTYLMRVGFDRRPVCESCGKHQMETRTCIFEVEPPATHRRAA